MQTERIAVVGSGVAGLVAAHAAARSGAHVTLYEADARAGGHADTSTVVEGDLELAIDTGFIVHNRHTYPVLCRLFDELGVATQPSEMSMSIVDERSGLEWAGARGLRGLFPTWRYLFNSDYLKMLTEVPRFHRAARELLAAPGAAADETLTSFVERIGLSAYFTSHFLEPLVAAVWSCDPEIAGEYPARYLFTFLQHHGMLSVLGSPEWRTVTGGSREYVNRVLKGLDEVHLGVPVESVFEHADGVEVLGRDLEQRRFDRVVIATHPAEALAMLTAATPAQKEVLSSFRYSPNRALLHTDARLMPALSPTWSSWNFRRPTQDKGAVLVTYDLTRLQRLPTSTHYFVTLGGEDLVDPSQVIATRDYAHPIYNPTSVAAQARLPEIATDRIAFAGAYHGWGFHEDGARSGLAAAERLGFHWPTGSTRPPAAERRAYRTEVRHSRNKPWLRTFSHTSYLWVVDIDAETDRPKSGWWPRLKSAVTGSVEARDHLGDPGLTLRENLETFLRTEGIELGDASVLLAAHPRAFGYCFNPISVWWCIRPDGSLLATVVEVHNTYGDRHAYLLREDAGQEHNARVPKAMYVSPFHSVDGSYDVRAPLPGDELSITVNLRTGDGAGFAASCRGQLVTGHRLRAATAGLVDSLRIRSHGVRIWLRRLPVQPRPTHYQEAVQ